MDPEAVKALATHCARLMSDEVRRFGGRVSSVMGDAIMAIFGAPVSHEDDPDRAVRAAAAMRQRVASVEGAPKPLQLHVGINTGEAMAGMIGPDEARDYTAMGDTTNTAARLMGAAPGGAIFVGEKTYRAIRRTVECQAREPVVAKGKAEPVPVWEVIEVPPLPEARPVGTAPLVGRSAELQEIHDVWSVVRQESRPALAVVLGPPGIGKTRLLVEFMQGVSETATVLRGRCLPYGEGITYWPVIEMVKGSAGIRHDDDPSTTSQRLGSLIEGLRTEDQTGLRTIATALATLVAVPSTPLGTYRATSITQGELHWGIRRLFELMAEGKPLVLVFEDLHWGEPTLLDLLDYLAENAVGPLLLLGSSRPEIADSWARAAEGGGGHSISLQALSSEESESIIATMVPGHTLGRRSLEGVLRSAAGNPLFLEETVRMLSDAGMLEPGSADLDDAAGIPVPTSIQGLIDSRLDLLPPEDRWLTQLASVVGLVFWSGLVSHLRGADGVGEALERLEVRDLIRALPTSGIADEREFAFKHALIRDVAYRRLPKRTRSDLHERCAGWVSRLPGSEDDLIEIVAYHLESACTLARELGPLGPTAPLWPAAQALARAAEKAERREGSAEADRFYARALALVGHDQREEVTELRLRRSRTLIALGQSKEATEILRRVADEAIVLGRLDLRGQAMVGLANVAQKLGAASEARDHLTEAGTIALEAGDRRLQIRTAYESAEIRADFEGRVDGAVDDLWLGLTMAEGIDDLNLRIEGHLRMGTVLATAGRLAEAAIHLERCAALAQQMGSYRDDARAGYLLAYVSHYLGRTDEARQLADRAAEWLERTADRYFQIQNLMALSRFALTDGDLDRAEGWIRQALPPARTLGGWLLVETSRYLVEVLVLQNRAGEAREIAESAHELVPKEDPFARAAALLADCLVAAAEGDTGVAARMEGALGLLEEQAVPIELAEAQFSCARALAVRGEEEEARRLLARVRAAAEGTEARLLITIADHMMAELGEGPARPAPSPVG